MISKAYIYILEGVGVEVRVITPVITIVQKSTTLGS